MKHLLYCSKCCFSLLILALFTLSGIPVVQAQQKARVNDTIKYISPVVVILKPGDTLKGRDSEHVKLVYVVTPDAQTTKIDALLTRKAVMVEGLIHQRGDATFGQHNGQYAFKLKEEPERHFLEMPKGGKDWILHEAGDFDHSLIRNVMAFHAQRQMGQWAPRTKYFEMFVITEPNLKVKADSAYYSRQLLKVVRNPQKYYYGVHINMEKIKVEHHRIDIGEFFYDTTTNALGACIIQMNQESNHYHNLPALTLTQRARVYEPKVGDISDAALNALKQWYLNTSGGGWGGNMQTLYINYAKANGCMTGSAPCYPCPSDSLNKLNVALWDQVRKTTDYQSMAVYFLMAELARDPDGYHKSTFMYKTADVGTTLGKVHGGPMWDKNKSFGNKVLSEQGLACGCKDSLPMVNYSDTFGWSYCMSSLSQAPVWWETLLLDTQFCKVVKDTWSAYRAPGGIFADQALVQFVEQQATYLKQSGAAQRHYTRWPSAYKFKTEVDNLEYYLGARLKWMDANLDALLLKTSGYVAK